MLCLFHYFVVFCLVFVSVLCGVLLCVWFGIVWCFALCLFRNCVVFCLVFVSVLCGVLPCVCFGIVWCFAVCLFRYCVVFFLFFFFFFFFRETFNMSIFSWCSQLLRVQHSGSVTETSYSYTNKCCRWCWVGVEVRQGQLFIKKRTLLFVDLRL